MRRERVRLSVKKRTAPPVGTFVQVKARLNPPLRPLRPGGYDFSRDLYFQRIGATGFVQRRDQDRRAAGAAVRVAALRDGHRQGMRDVDRHAHPRRLSGDAGAIASALITGKRDAISAPVNDAMYISEPRATCCRSPATTWRVVAGVVFFVVRALLALVAGAGAALRDQEMGGARGADARPSSICCCPARRSRRSARSS